MCILNSICKGHDTPATIKGVLRILAWFVAYVCNVTQRDTNRIATTVGSVLWYQLSRNGTVSGHNVTPSLFIEYMTCWFTMLVTFYGITQIRLHTQFYKVIG